MRLARRVSCPPSLFEQAMSRVETRYGASNFTPDTSIDTLCPGTYYLEEIDSMYCRKYARKKCM